MISGETARLDERVDEGGRKSAFMEQIMSDAAELSGVWRRQFQTRSGKGLIDWGCRNWKMAGQPVEGFFEAEVVQMDDQIFSDRAETVLS